MLYCMYYVKVKVCTVCAYIHTYACVRACVCIAGAWLLVKCGSEVEACSISYLKVRSPHSHVMC